MTESQSQLPGRLVQFAPIHVYPPDTGGRHRTHGIVSAFPDLGCRVDRFCQGAPARNYLRGRLLEVVEVADRYREIRALNPAYELARLPAIGGYPYSFLSRALRLHTPDFLETLCERSDLLLVEGPWQADAATRIAGDAPVVYSSHNVEADLFANLDGRPLYEHLFPAVEETERRAIESADALVCVSAENRDRFRELYDPDCPVVIAPNATSADAVRPNVAPQAARAVRRRHGIDEDAHLAVFVGSGHQPNVEAARELVDLYDGRIDGHLLVVGDVGEELRATPASVTVAGFVEDLDPVYTAADVALNPVTRGSGSNVKLLEFLAHEVPVVSTPFGARGIDVEDGDHLIVAPLEEFPAAIDRLRDPDLADRLGRTGADLVADRYTWDRVSRRLFEDLVEVLDLD